MYVNDTPILLYSISYILLYYTNDFVITEEDLIEWIETSIRSSFSRFKYMNLHV